METALNTAIEYAQQGWYVFPIQPGSKYPFKDFAWRDQSTNDPDKVRKAGNSAKYKGCNWALDCGRSGITVLDVDVKPDYDGHDSLAALPSVQTGLVVDTPSGGTHYYFTGSAQNSTSKLGRGLDTRGEGGYVLIPGSTVNGRPYTCDQASTPAPVPTWLTDRLSSSAPTQRKEDRDIPVCDLDSQPNVNQAVNYLANQAPEATEGHGGDQTTYEVACRVRDYAISAETALELMLEHWNDTKANPPWAVEDLERKIRNAYSYAKDRPGNSTPEALFPDPLKSTNAIRCAAETSINDIKPREWLLGYWYLPQYATITVAPGGVGKSLLTILECMSVASGKQLTHDPVHRTGATWYYNTEDPLDELDRRVMAAAMHNKLTKQDLKNFYYSSGYDTPIKLAGTDDHGKAVVAEHVVSSVIKAIKDRNIKLFVIDPLVRCHGLSENDNGDMDLLMQVFSRIARQTGCAIGLVHHTPKGSKERGNMDAARGASAIVSAARIARTLYGMSDKECKEYGISEERRKWFVRLDDAKANLAPPGDGFSWYQKQSVQLTPGTAETTGTLEPVSLNKVIAEDTDTAISEAAMAMVGVGVERSVFSIAQEIELLGVVGDLKTRAITRRIEAMFAMPVTRGNLVYKASMGTGERGKPALMLTCFKQLVSSNNINPFD